MEHSSNGTSLDRALKKKRTFTQFNYLLLAKSINTICILFATSQRILLFFIIWEHVSLLKNPNFLAANYINNNFARFNYS